METFSLPTEIPIDRSHTLDQLTGRFQTVKDGLPEIVKNSKDQYSRLGILGTTHRPILVFVSTARRSLGVLDFAGASIEDFDGWTTWSSRTAGRTELAGDIEAGHGNGGKAFMVRGSNTFSYMDSCSDGRRTKMGFLNKSPDDRYKPGYARQGRTELRDVEEPNVEARLAENLKKFDLDLSQLPSNAAEEFHRRNAFTVVYVGGIKDWSSRKQDTIERLAQRIPDILAQHGQAALSVETCRVSVMVDGQVIKSPIQISHPKEYEGFESLSPIPVPDKLIDPMTEETIATGPGGLTEKFLQLRTSEKHLRLSEDLKARNVIRIWNSRNNVANWPLAELTLLASSSFIMGELRVPSLQGEHLADAHRSILSDTPLTRALQNWTSEQVEELAKRIQQAQIRETRPEDRERASRTLNGLRELMRRYLDPSELVGPQSGESGGSGNEGDSDGDGDTREGAKYGTTVEEIVLEPTHDRISVAKGTSIPLLYRCYEVLDDGRRLPVREAAVTLHTALHDHARFEDGTLTSTVEGSGDIWLESADGGIKSNRIVLEVLPCTSVDILPSPDPLLQGQKTKLPIVFHTTIGPRDDLLVDAAIEEQDLAWIGRHGIFTAGLQEGSATVRVRYAAEPSSNVRQSIIIGPDRVPYSGSGGDRGGNVPEVLLCGDPAPGMDAYPEEQRTHHGGEHFPTIIEEPQFPGIVWINPHSKESTRVRRTFGGSVGIGGIATKTFMHFVALKCFEILKRLKVRQELRENTVNETQFTQLIAQAEMDCADFIDAAYDLSETLIAAES